MKLMIVLMVMALIACTLPSLSCASGWEYDTGFRSELTFLHEFVNYEFDPDTEHRWEQGLMNESGMRFSYGSISKYRLFQRHDVLINSSLGNGWRFRTHVRRYGTDHRSEDVSSADLGFLKSITGNLSLCVYSDLSHEKDEIDGSVGMLFTGSDSTDYVQTLFVWNDLAYDKRNDGGGNSTRKPLGFEWLVRLTPGNWEIFTSGTLSAGFRRRFDDARLSPHVRSHEHRVNEASLRLIRHMSNSSRWEAALSYYRFHEDRRYTDVSQDYDYRNCVAHGVVRYLCPWRESYRLRLETHGIGQVRESSGYKRFRYERHEIMPAVFLARLWKRHSVEVGYFGSVYGWDYDDRDDSLDFDRDDYIDKMRIGWSYSWGSKSWVQISLSHVVSLSNFGGGNMQYVILF